MDQVNRLLPIAVVIIFAILVNPFQANAQTFPNAVPLQFKYQSGNINDEFIVNEASQPVFKEIKISPFWGFLILLIPLGYLAWSRIGDVLPSREPVGRGYSIAYQDIRRFKKRTIKIPRKAKAF